MKQDNINDSAQRQKEIAFWNLYTLNNLNSLTDTIAHHPYPQLHNQYDRNWRDLFFHKQYRPNGEQMPQTFISRSIKYMQNSVYSTLDRVSLYRSQQHDLLRVKNQFWRKVYHLQPTSKENYECRKIVRNIVLRERLLPYCTALFVGFALDRFSGIYRLKIGKRVVPFIVLLISSEILVTVKRSDSIFYAIPKLPLEQLQKERIEILKQCLVFDGKINSYGLPDGANKIFLNQFTREREQVEQLDKSIQSTPQEDFKREILIKNKNQLVKRSRTLLDAAGFNVLEQADVR